MYHIFWHKNPDTDAICSALVAAEYFRLMEIDATPYRIGNLNPETEFVLRELGIEPPEFISELPEGSEIILVDHNAVGQTIDHLEKYRLKGIIDHHSLENLSTHTPIQLRFEPLCSTCSVLFTMFAEQELEMSDQIARLILAWILSDSLAFRSPTTTDEDREIVDFLAEDLGIVDIQSYAKKMFDAKSDLGDLSICEIIELDYKVYEVADKHFGYGVMETTTPEYALQRKGEILQNMQVLKERTGLYAFFFSVVDILNEKNTTFVLSDIEAAIIYGAFGVNTTDSLADLGNRVSRKKELEPLVRQYLENN